MVYFSPRLWALCLPVATTGARRRHYAVASHGRFAGKLPSSRTSFPSELDQIVAHGNFEAAFEIRRGARTSRPLRRELLDKIYELRSGLVHSGLRPTYHGFGNQLTFTDDIRRILLADFAEGAILGYLASPRSSLIGHPKIPKPNDLLTV
jgi:hypothetical protein